MAAVALTTALQSLLTLVPRLMLPSEPWAENRLRDEASRMESEATTGDAGNQSESLTTRCYGVYGCFSVAQPFLSMARPINTFPMPPEALTPTLCLYTRNNPRRCQRLPILNVRPVRRTHFRADAEVKILTHGYLEHGEKRWLKKMTAEYLQWGDVNVVVVSWVAGAGPPYTQCVANARLLGAMLGRFILNLQEELAVPASRVHFVGHSLGAHMAGYAGHYLRTRGAMLGHITGLDPAEPYFEGTDPVVRLDPSDATLVTVIHTDAGPILTGGLGMFQPSGHYDFYPNGGITMPGCGAHLAEALAKEQGNIPYGIRRFLGCNHIRSYEYFTESINSACPFLGVQCPSWEAYRRGACWDCKGETTSKGGRGRGEGRKREDGRRCVRMGAHAATPFVPPDNGGGSGGGGAKGGGEGTGVGDARGVKEETEGPKGIKSGRLGRGRGRGSKHLENELKEKVGKYEGRGEGGGSKINTGEFSKKDGGGGEVYDNAIDEGKENEQVDGRREERRKGWKREGRKEGENEKGRKIAYSRTGSAEGREREKEEQFISIPPVFHYHNHHHLTHHRLPIPQPPSAPISPSHPDTTRMDINGGRGVDGSRKLYLITGADSPFCSFQHRVTVVMSNTAQAKAHGGDIGVFHITLVGDKGSSGRLQLNPEEMFFEPGLVYTFLVGTRDLGPLRYATLHWAYITAYYSPLSWRLLSRPSVFVNRLYVDALETQHRYEFCGLDQAFPSGTERRLVWRAGCPEQPQPVPASILGSLINFDVEDTLSNNLYSVNSGLTYLGNGQLISSFATSVDQLMGAAMRRRQGVRRKGETVKNELRKWRPNVWWWVNGIWERDE